MKGFCNNFFSVKTFTILVCYGIVSWQTYKCFDKYFEKPHGTKLKIISPRAEFLPLFTICKEDKPRYNESTLQSCNIQKAANYFDDFQWLGNCSNPEELFERSTVNKSELIKCMRPYNYFNQLPSNLKTPEVNLPNEYIQYIDRRQFGRCYTIRMTDPNISSYRMNFYETVKIYFHSLGTMKSSYPRVYMRIKPDQRMTVALGYDVFDFLSTTEEPCEENIDYSEDDCIDKLVHRDSMKEIGCTTPWGKNKSTICTSSSKAKMAADLYNKYFWMGTTCPNPCKFLKVRASVLYSNQDPERNTSALYINLDNKISYYESYFTYLPLSLIAEIGGYVGLFLGISFNQFHELVDFLKSKIFKILRN